MLPIDSAAVLMLRDAPQGLEIFLVKRHGATDVFGSVYVFPGGKVDAADAALATRLDMPAASLSESMGEPDLSEDGAVALHVAAIRELFEETGTLLADTNSARARDAWTSLRKGRRFEEVLRAIDVPLAASRLTPWARWITPLGSAMSSKRFDARFFVATVPADQEPSHDADEVTEGTWLSPKGALQRYWDGEMKLAPPQIMSLAHLARHTGIAGVLAEAGTRVPPSVLPEIHEQAGERVLCFPGDRQHAVRQSVLPGPTRLCWRNDRYEPEGGIDSLVRPDSVGHEEQSR